MYVLFARKFIEPDKKLVGSTESDGVYQRFVLICIYMPKYVPSRHTAPACFRLGTVKRIRLRKGGNFRENSNAS